ncbi:YhcH/YjgK/YiaL family protein [Saccharicrinis sp. FJH54]|uniref:YhcH/YjgK/YiaL family protein n=1 Tax=Saccharicrinis sp. FJH54 TaxID=3344665 RepID=UPI0035D40304
MVTDKLSNAPLYYALGERIKKGLEYIQKTDFSLLEDGKYTIDGDAIFAAVSHYSTKPVEEAKTENHRNYIDIQYVVKGQEKIGYAPYKGQEPSVAYNSEKDVSFYDCPVSLFTMNEGSFAIFFPDDIHTPGVAVTGPGNVMKVVVKIRVD